MDPAAKTEEPTDELQRENDRFIIRRILIPVTVLFVLVGSFYGIENWRGERAWKKAVAELTAKGEVLEWKKFVPEPIPDEDNMLKAPHMEDWFVHGNAPFKDNSFLQPVLEANRQRVANGPIPIGTLRLVGPGEAAPGPNVFEWEKVQGDLGRKLVAKEMANQLSFDGKLRRFYGTTLVNSFYPADARVSLVFVLPGSPGASLPADLGRHFKSLVFYGHNWGTQVYKFDLKETDQAGIHTILITEFPTLQRSDVVKATDAFEEVYQALIEAAKRPGVYLRGSYAGVNSVPSLMHASTGRLNELVMLRLEARLTEGNKAAAARELEVLRALNRLSLTNQCHYATFDFQRISVVSFHKWVARGLAVHAWDKSLLEELAREAAGYSLLKSLGEVLRAERAGRAFGRETVGITVAEMCQLPKDGWPKWGRKADDFVWKFAPQGWKRQNMASYCLDMQTLVEELSSGNHSPTPFPSTKGLLAHLKSNKLYDRWAAKTIPRYSNQFWLVFRAQTQAHLVVLGCALERHRLETGTFPETLAALSPAYLAKAPVQVVNGQPYHYRREADGGYSLWSEGWDLRDDGGVFEVGGEISDDNADWGWRMPPGRAAPKGP